jgi:regulator of nucleoside diphosphate kinase
LNRLKEVIAAGADFDGKGVVRYLNELDAELESAELIKSQEIPDDVITMNSTFRLRNLDTREDVTYTLVFPNEADSSKGNISILAPIGTAVLGYRVGDVVEWPVPAGLKRLKVDEIIYQPEAAGDFHR